MWKYILWLKKCKCLPDKDRIWGSILPPWSTTSTWLLGYHTLLIFFCLTGWCFTVNSCLFPISPVPGRCSTLNTQSLIPALSTLTSSVFSGSLVALNINSTLMTPELYFYFLFSNSICLLSMSIWKSNHPPRGNRPKIQLLLIAPPVLPPVTPHQ